MAPHTTLHDPLMAQEKPTYFRYKGPEDFSTAIDVARHYGFHLVEPIEPKKRFSKAAKKAQGDVKREKTGEFYIHLEDKLAELERYIDGMQGWPQPAMIAHTLHPRRKVGKLRLSMFGCCKTISEGMAIATAMAVLRELGFENLGVEINSVGGHETKRRFTQEFKEHVKENLNDMRPTCQTRFKEDILSVASCTDETCSDITAEGPNPINFLDKSERAHLTDICEYLEALGAPYRINEKLVGSQHHHTETVFHIREFDDDGNPDSEVLARGQRHHSTAESMGYARTIPTISTSIDVPGGRRESYKEVEHEDVEQPSIYYVHLGNDAKKASLPVLERLRQDGITVLQALTRDKIHDQISVAERLHVPHAIIMGKKEAEEKSVIVRDMLTRSQQTIPVGKLSRYLKKVA